MNIYSETDYRVIISTIMDERKKINTSITYQSLADSIRIQKSYLSRVMNGRADFSTDQLFMVCKHLDLTKEDTDYILLLLEYERSLYPERREELLEEIEKIRDEKRDSKHGLKRVEEMKALEFDSSIFSDYYTNSDYALVHMMLAVERMRTNLHEIREALNLTENRFSEILNKLEKMELIENQDGEIVVIKKRLHLPKGSKLEVPHMLLMKQKSSQHLLGLEKTERTSFIATFTSNRKSFKKIQDRFNEFLKDVQTLSSEGKATGCYQFNFDLFPWNKD